MGTIGGNICLDTRCNWYDQSSFWRKAMGYCMKLPALTPSTAAEDGIPCRVAVASPTCLATFSADTVPTLVGYDASIRVAGPSGERTIAMRDLYRMDGMRWLKLEPGEILLDVTIPDPEGLQATYLKLRDRGSFDFPLAGVFVGVRTDGNGVVDRARMVLTGVYSMPVELTEAQNAVLGHRLEADVIAAAAEAAYAASRPVDNTGGTIIQRRRTIRVFVRRALEELAASAAGAS
jgi:4-hydroxybenzoyl-CoA reductase subunit beta